MVLLQRSSVDMAKQWQSLQILKGRGVAELLDAFGKLASKGLATHCRGQQVGAETSESLTEQLARLCVGTANSMRAPTGLLSSLYSLLSQ